MRILGRRYTWAVNHTRTCTTFSIPGGPGGTRGPVRRVRSCQVFHSDPPVMYAADGMLIPFPARYRRSEAYQTARSVLVEIFLDVDPEALDTTDSEPAAENGPDGEIDFESLQGRYSYLVLIAIRQPSGLIPISWPDLIPGIPVPVSVAISTLTPSSLGGSAGYSRRLPNGRTAVYSVLL